MARLQAVRGMADILMADTPRWRYLEETIQAVFSQYGYQEIRLPIVEKTALFTNAIGDQTDIVAKEMYSFDDRRGAGLTLRPEGTAGCVRAGIEHGFFHNQIQRLWYQGAMFRYERPQQGRQRQFHQMGVEAFGLAGPAIDAELILLSARIFKKLNLDNVRLELNSLGLASARLAYRQILQDYFKDHQTQLDSDSLLRLAQNPLRILDSKEPSMQALIQAAPLITDCLEPESADHFAQLTAILDDNGIAYTINPRLVRGLDYYTKTVFEWVTDAAGAQNAVCAGGRYDNLIEQHGGKNTPAIGFAIGLERLLALSTHAGLLDRAVPHVYMIRSDPPPIARYMKLAETLRQALPQLRLIADCSGASLKSQFKKADKSGATLAIMPLDDDQIEIKFLRDNQAQIQKNHTEIIHFLAQKLFSEE